MARSRFAIPTLLAAALFASVALAFPAHAFSAHAQHDARRDAHRPARTRARSMAPHAAPHAATASRVLASDDYSLEIVAALFPYDDGVIHGEPVLTLVVENRGTAPAPAFSVDVTQRTRLAAFSRAPVAMLAPGERVLVQIPLEMTPSGAPCVAVTLDSWSRQGPPSQVYAALPAAPLTPASPLQRVSHID